MRGLAPSPSGEHHHARAGHDEQQAQREWPQDSARPWQVATGKEARPEDLPEGVTPVKLAGYTVVARVILNLDETIMKE